MNDRYNKWLNDNGISESDKEILKNMTEKEKEEGYFFEFKADEDAVYDEEIKN